MALSSPQQLPVDRHSSSYIPGGFEIDNEEETSEIGGLNLASHQTLPRSQSDSPLKAASTLLPDAAKDYSNYNFVKNASSDIKEVDPTYQPLQTEDHQGTGEHNTVLEEAEMNRKLGDFESSFIPELSHLSVQRFDNARLQSNGNQSTGRGQNESWGNHFQNSGYSDFLVSNMDDTADSLFVAHQSQTPPSHYMTPAPEQQISRQASTPGVANTSRLEIMSSSPTAARTVSRVQSMATIGGYETADDQDFQDSPSKRLVKKTMDPDATPRKPSSLSSSQNTVHTAIKNGDIEEPSVNPSTRSRRPKYLNSRTAPSRLSYDSIASSTTETSDATLSADFALQSGGAAPDARSQRKPRMTLSRSTSLGSIVSGVSNFSDDEGTTGKRAIIEPPELSTLHEESPGQARTGKVSPNPSIVVTPRPSHVNLSGPSETVITNHVRDLEVPGSFARQYRRDHSIGISPEKPISMAAMTPSTKKGLTLKEHRSTVEKLGKENFDLKMKIHFLDQALEKRSEDGVKEMITENVQLKSDRMRLEKENHGLRKQVRELQRRLDDTGTGDREDDQGYETDEERRSPTAEEELMYLRERVEVNEVEISRLRKEGMERESEKRKLAEMVRSLGERGGTGSDAGSREERDMWKDMLEAETIAREQSEEECKKLRDEIAKLRQDTFGTNSRLKKGRIGGSVVSRSSSVEGSTIFKPDNAEIDRLRHENSELQKMIGAQASTLTSRNKEKERLYQEIEDLKLGRMGGLRSVAGDSILDRSASRARSNSRASNGTRFSRLSEPEREQFEVRIGELRDEVSQLRLDNQNLQNQFEEALIELDAVDAQAQADADHFNEELGLLTQERDNALREAEDQDQAFQQLKNEAQEEIDGLGDELDAKVEECERLEQAYKAQAESLNSLQAEMGSASEGLVRLEQDAQQNLARYQTVKAELDEANRELEGLEKSLTEAEGKIQRFTVQQESSHNEIAFLREEADGDKIKIGDLESLLKKVHLNLDSERDRAKDLERRLGEERQQKDTVSSQEKQEVQRMLTDLNREVTATKDELRRAKKALSSREIEVTTYQERLTELEESLRHTLRDPNATRSGLINSVARMQRELDQVTVELDRTRRDLDEHQDLLSNRDGLLESSSLECRKLSDLLERERQARRQDKHSFEQSLKSHQQSARALSANNARIVELEQQRHGHRKQLNQLEGQFKDQLAERNQVLLNLWKKLSALCGPDWAHNHSLINGNLPSQEVVGNILFWPGFSRNLLLAAKQVEDTLSNMKEKIKKVDRELWKEYRNLEQMLESRNKKLERIEEGWEKMKLRQQELEAGILPATHMHHNQSHRGMSRSTSHNSQPLTPDMQKLKVENRLLKAELQLLQRQQSNATAHNRAHHRTSSRASVLSGGLSTDGLMSLDGAASITGGGIPARTTSMHRNPVSRTNSTGTLDHFGPGENHVIHDEHGADDEYPSFPERNSLMIPARPFVDPQPPTHGNFPRPPAQSNKQAGTMTSNSSDAGTITTATLLGKGQAHWIHQLRELERRLKAEREQRVIDRSGMRRRLEEREAVNESLRKELERERIRRSWAEGDDMAQVTREGQHAQHDHDHDGPGKITMIDRAVEVGAGRSGEMEGSPARTGSVNRAQ